MSKLTRDGTAEPFWRDRTLRHARGQGNIHFSLFSWPRAGLLATLPGWSILCYMWWPYIQTYIHTHTGIYYWFASVCVFCVFFPSILDIKFVGRTSRGHTGGRSHRIFYPPSFCGACLDFCREKDSAIPFPRRPWSRILCTNELIVLHPLGIFILVF